MTALTTYTCDGCGTTAEERAGYYPLNWANPTFLGYGTKHFCTVCSPRVAIYGERLSCPCPEVEAACAPLREGLESLERLYEASKSLEETLRNEMAQARISHVEAAADAHRANEENTRLYKALEEAREANEAALNRAEIAEERETKLLHEVASLKADHEYDEEVNRALVLELLNMLGKKARRRNKKRLREIRLAVSMEVSGDDEVTS